MLTVYRASAGAGKTHRLTGEYLLLLFSRSNAYKRILAVTFTNKATEEMKSRIIQELHILSSGRKSDYLSLLSGRYHLSEEEVREKARKLLISILHDYSSFQISTIDRFFQQTMHSFTREIGLQGGYGIELDQELVLTEVIDNLLAGLEKPENKDLLGWLIRFAEEKIENGGDWKLNRDIMALSRELFKENYKSFSDDLSRNIEDKKALESYKDELMAIIRSVEKEARESGERGMSILRQYGLQPSDFKGGSRSPLFYFERLAAGEMKEPTATFCGLADNQEGCYTKTTPAATVSIIGCAFENGLNDCIKGIISLFTNLSAYYTAKEIVRYYYTLGILTDVSRQLATYREEKNILLIADTTELLHKIIDGSEPPFIYEKTGTGIDHYMIDEFQDTSGMQWHNFKPLIDESLANDRDNLIVGDVKQSIYRFRNSDWKLLDEGVQRQFTPVQLKEKTLADNWRSCRHIVGFNNSLFSIAPSLLQILLNEQLESSSLPEEEQAAYLSRIRSAYNECCQRVPTPFKDKKGHVKVDFLATDEEGDWKEKALKKLPEVIERLQDNGYELKDMAILVRTNQEGAMVADTLLSYKEENPSEKYKYDIISDDALFIGSSSTIRFIVSILRHLKDPEDKTFRQMALFSYATLSGEWGESGQEMLAFPEEMAQTLDKLSRQSLYEITEGIYRIFSPWFPVREQVFVQAFLDMVSEYTQKETADITRFLRWWDESGYRKTITTPDSQNAIRILTIHKSKGLGFKAVLVPFTDWEIDHKPTKPVILWCRPQEAPFNRLPLVPVRYSQGLSKTFFAHDYFHEKLHACIDNLNTLYVALTRAKEELILFSQRPRKLKEKSGEVEKMNSIADLLWNSLRTPGSFISAEEELIDLSTCFNPETGSFESGTWWSPAAQKNNSQDMEETLMSRFDSVSPDDRLRLRLLAKGYTLEDSRRKHGILMHEVLSRIHTEKDIDLTVDRYRFAGIIQENEGERIKQKLHEWMCFPGVSQWFNGSCSVLNEVNILFEKGNMRRPDRVVISDECVTVIDYKFGEIKEKRHHTQIKKYIWLIRQMGYKEVKGFLWYLELNELEPVNG